MGLILVANPGSASRKYALFDDSLTERAQVHIEFDEDDSLIGTLHSGEKRTSLSLDFTELEESAAHVHDILKQAHLLAEDEAIDTIGIRIVAPSNYFMQDHVITDEVVAKLEAIEDFAPIHIAATRNELHLLRTSFPNTTIIGVSDSAFHAKKPAYAWNYGIAIHDADRFDIKRFGYHGLSISAAVSALWNSGKLPPRVVVCHLGSGSSVTGVFHGRSIDTTMGYTPLEGVVMATRVGSIDFGAARALKKCLHLDDDGFETYLHRQSGLLGLGHSNDIRELIEREADGDHLAHLALTTLVHSIHKAIGSMIVAMNGCDMIVFTGTAGERSAFLHKRIVAHLTFLDFAIDGTRNSETTSPEKLTVISQAATSKPIIVIPTNEAYEIARHCRMQEKRA